MTPWALYLHLPLCQLRCAYCDFNTYAGLDHLRAPYIQALAREIRQVGAAAGRPAAHTVFFGGGTPSLIPLDLQAALFAALREAFDLSPDCEVTLEANPGTVSRAYLEGLRALGVNRLSFGVQSSHPHELRLLDRLHLFGDAAQAVTWARQAGFDNVSLDLMFGLPGQTLGAWQATLLRTLSLGPDHLSAYALSLEHGTPMRAWVQRGLLPEPDPDLAADMYLWADEALLKQGFVQYEISNWARGREGQEAGNRRQEAEGRKQEAGNQPPASCLLHPTSCLACRHNLQYWRNLPYLGFGAGAHGCAGGWRYSNVLSPAAYVERMKTGAPREFPFSPAMVEAKRVTAAEAMGETLMLGLRLVGEGVSADDFRARFGVDLGERYAREIQRLQARGLVEWDGARLRLSPGGRLLGNQVFMEFV